MQSKGSLPFCLTTSHTCHIFRAATYHYITALEDIDSMVTRNTLELSETVRIRRKEQGAE